ncbi:hypothetical protein BJX65DRAFT_312030 [Aspergillus insuetus]
MSSESHTSGYEVPDVNRGGKIIGAVLATTIPALIVVGLRFYVRVFILNHVNVSDHVMGFALLFAYVHVSHDSATDALFYYFLAGCFYLWTISLAKVSIGLALLPLTLKKAYKWSTWMVIVSMLVYTTGRFFTIMFQCNRIASSWDLSIKSDCYSRQVSEALMYSYSAVNILTDFIFAILPINLNLNFHLKASLAIIFGLGIFTFAAGCIKLLYVHNYGRTSNYLWDITYLAIWVVVECNIAIIAGSLPMLKPLYRRLVQRTGYRNNNTGTRSATENLDLQSLGRTGAHSQTAVSSPRNKDKDRKFWYSISTTRTTHGVDNASDESILRMEASPNVPGSGIHRTMDISVSYS